MLLKVEKRERAQYWVTGLPPYRVNGQTYTDAGPYPSRQEAAASRDSMLLVLQEMEVEDGETA